LDISCDRLNIAFGFLILIRFLPAVRQQNVKTVRHKKVYLFKKFSTRECDSDEKGTVHFCRKTAGIVSLIDRKTKTVRFAVRGNRCRKNELIVKSTCLIENT